MFYTLVAERLGLSVSDLRAWDLLVGLGPLSARQFADHTGLTPGAVTGLIDRLERAGAVKRTTDPRDRRKVIVTVLSELRTGHASIYFELVFRQRLSGCTNDIQMKKFASFTATRQRLQTFFRQRHCGCANPDPAKQCPSQNLLNHLNRL